jgi:HD superfamily phosphohydrolase
MRTHSPQDQVHGQLQIPDYCWGIIDTPEFQRLRYIRQLGPAFLVFPGATHTRFEHSLGVAHLAYTFIEHIATRQSYLNVREEYRQAVVIAGLCHDCGHGPWSHTLEVIGRRIGTDFRHEEMSVDLLRHIVRKYALKIKEEVVEAACCYILGKEYKGYPVWLSKIVANHEDDIDLDKFDYLARDMNCALTFSSPEYSRLMLNCRVIGDNLAFKISERQTIVRLFQNRNDMFHRVYTHETVHAIESMITDVLDAAAPYLNFKESLTDIDKFCAMDDRILYSLERGDGGEEAQRLVRRISERQLYVCVGELHMGRADSSHWSQIESSSIEQQISSCSESLNVDEIRAVKCKYRYGIRNRHPLLYIPFWSSSDCDKVIWLTESDLSTIAPVHFVEVDLRIFVTNVEKIRDGERAFEKWRNSLGLS